MGNPMLVTATIEEIHARYMLKMERRNRKTGQTTVVDYLQVAGRILLFRIAYPEGNIKTEMVYQDDKGAIFKAVVITDDGKELATGYARAIYATSDMYNGRVCEKAETAARGRALAAAGYGTDCAGEDLDETDEETSPAHLADAPRENKSKPAAETPWYEDPEKWGLITRSLENKSISLSDAEKLTGKPLNTYPTAKEAFQAVLDGLSAQLANTPPAKPKGEVAAPAHRADDWLTAHQEKLTDLAGSFEFDLPTLLKALGKSDWHEFKSFDEARKAILGRANDEAWSVVGRKATFESVDGKATRICFDTPIKIVWMAGKHTLAEQMIKHGAKDTWNKIIDYKDGDHQLPEPVRIMVKKKPNGALAIDYVESALSKKIG